MTENLQLYQPYLGKPVIMIGAGGIGSNLIPLLVKCGPSSLAIWDDDTVEPVNLAQQNFNFGDIQCLKAKVLAKVANDMDPTLEVVCNCRRFEQGDNLDGLVVSGVDSIEARRLIFDEVLQQADRIDLFIDGRLSRTSNEWVELYFIDPKKSTDIEFYRDWLYPGETLGSAGPRPTKLSAHTPILLAGLVGAVLARWIHDGRHPRKVTCDASTFTLTEY